MVWRAPLRVGTRSVILLGRTICGLLDVGHGIANVIVRLSLTLFCLGLVLQALSNAADPYRCRALIRHGSWPPYAPPKVNAAADYEQLETLQREGREPPPARPFDKWEPAGCRMHEYSREDIRECLGGKRVLFVGDTTMRVLFFAALTRLEHEVAEWLLRTTFTESNPRHDLAIDSETVHLHFIWDPWLNSTALDDEIRMMEPGGDKHAGTELKPDLVIIGSVGLWAARNAADDKYFDTFCTATDRVTRVMGDEVRPFDGQHSANYVFLAPVTIPRYEMLLPGRAEAISPDRIKRMNNYLANVSPAVQSHILTSYNDMTNHIPEAYEDTGLHVTATGPSINGVRLFDGRARANSTNSTNPNFGTSLPDDVRVRNSVSQDAGWLDRVLIAVLYRDEFTAPIQTMIVIFSSVFFFGFASATSMSPLVEDDTSHPYITSVAVACFAVVRNCHSQLRARYMMLPAALGTMALELFVLHNHILLSGNGTGHLRLLSLYPSAVEEGASFLENVSRAKIATVHCLEIVSITVVFLLVARHTYKSTRFLSLLLFGDRVAEYGGHSPLPASIRGPVIGIDASLAAFDSGHYELPEYGDDDSLTAAKEPPAIHLSPTNLGVQIRAASVLLLLWGFNKFYL
ncbi:hypothetical protein SPBR_09107 [Sporothrix brasiliensis 5110]|uniref:Cas1p 10 TM acyl transferase domain-containing protein n=1 Tax=Sporothrix brasiliensis 5110 TaxID=1398154 RepID=A0A0C2J1S7_9PEZI|nr:uncharacterized protein SPBR_09107 [Sporothrix brasiliensis 5110]KIH92955.1 hypothetical protein SPBR_09107 [Sporothrix brasiliensis 5110]